MIQIKCPTSSSIITNDFYLDIYDKIQGYVYRPLILLKSQLTKYSKIASLGVGNVGDSQKRYIYMQIVSTNGLVAENLPERIVRFGTTNFPLGFYDAIIYKNTSNDNMDISGLSVVYNGLAHVTGETTAVSPVKYSEYTTNDSDTESVYITF